VSLSTWRLPSTSAWLDTVLADIDDDACVVMRIARSMGGEDLFDIVRTDRPAVWFEHVVLGPGQSLADGILGLAEGALSLEQALARVCDEHMVVWLATRETLDPIDLERVAEAHRHASDAPRALVIEHRGMLAAGGRAAPTLRIHHLYGVITALDSHVMLSQAGAQISPSRRGEIVELAAFDLELASQLAAVDRPSQDVYREICTARCEALALDTPVALPDAARISRREPRALEAFWQQGAFDVFDGVPVIHAGLSTETDIRRRLWRGQVRVLLPFLDEMRLHLIEAVARKGLTVYPSVGDTVELVDVLRALERNMGNHELTSAARELTRARNDLAHLRLVDEAARQRLRAVLRRARLAEIGAV